MHDRIEKMGQSLIQHGPFNDRIYLMQLDERDLPGILRDLEELACRNNYSKIFAKIPAKHTAAFEQNGYVLEAVVPGFYNASEDAAFISRFMTDERQRATAVHKERLNLLLAERKWGNGLPDNGSSSWQIRATTAEDAEEMAQVYNRVFPTYPFPIHDPEYLRSTMQSHVKYFAVLEYNKIVALSSAEMDKEHGNAEMTDFATLPEHRGQKLAIHLLQRMEEEMKGIEIPTLYTIARALSPGMNITFSRMGYIFAGTLVNNTNISGHIESMNVWYKHAR